MSMFSGIWPNENPDVSYRLRTFISWSLSLGVASCMLVEVIYDIRDFVKLSQTLYMMITWIAYIIKLAGFMYNGKVLLRVMNFLDDPIFMSFPENFDHYLLKPFRLTTWLCNLMRAAYMSCIPLYLFYPILDNKPLPFPFPYDLGKYRYLMFAFQLTGEACAAWNNSCLDTICVSLIDIATAQLDILEAKLTALKQEEDSDNDENSKKKVRYIKQCVKHHLAIMKLVKLIERIFTVGLLAQFLTTILINCNTVLQFMWVTFSGEFIVLLIYLFAATTQIFLYCWYGNELILKSLQIQDACYMSKWYESDKEVRTYLFLMMERCKRPLKITTMKFSVLSLVSFVAIMQWSYSVLALMINMYNKKQIA